MRVLMLTSSYPKRPGDGTSPFIAYLAEGVAAREGWEVEVLMPDHPELVLEREGTRAGLHRHRYVPFQRWSLWGFASSLAADREIRWQVFLLAPLVQLSAVWAALRLTRARPVDLVHVHWVIPNGPLGVIVARWRGVPMVVSLHGSDVYVAERSGWLRRLAGAVFRRARQVVACSDDLRDRARALGAATETSVTVPYGVDLDAFRARGDERAWLRERCGLPADAPVVVAAGRFVSKKGFDVLLRALPAVAARHPGVRLVLAGDGDLRPELERLATELGVRERLALPGSVTHTEMPRFLAGADVVAVPSVRCPDGNVDGLPNVLQESLASGAAVVATRIAGIPQVLSHDENGHLVEPDDPGELAAALAGLLDDPGRRARLGAEARRRAERAQGWEATTDRYLALYDEALGRARPAPGSGSGDA